MSLDVDVDNERSEASGRSRNTGKFVGEISSTRRRFDRRHVVKRLADWLFRKDGGLRSSFDGVTRCGFALGAEVALKSDGRRVWPSGVRSCGLVWVCPVCSAKIAARRCVELEKATAAHVARGGRLSMVTSTVRHDSSMPLAQVLKAVRDARRAVQSRTSWRELKKRVDGQVVATEVTVGDNGWHPHLHALFFLKPGVAQSEIDSLVDAYAADWRELVAAALGMSPSIERGVHVLHFGTDHAAAAAKYVSKISKEMTAAGLKSGRDPFSLLDGAGQGDAQSIARWIEYADAMKGAQSIRWSTGLRALLEIEEMTDEEIADADVDLGVVVRSFGAADWDGLVRSGRVGEALEEMEELVRGVGVAFLANHVT